MAAAVKVSNSSTADIPVAFLYLHLWTVDWITTGGNNIPPLQDWAPIQGENMARESVYGMSYDDDDDACGEDQRSTRGLDFG